MFALCHPHSLREALAAATADSLWLAGGQKLLPDIAHGDIAPALLISLAGIPELAQIAADGEHLRIGSMCTPAEIAANPLVQQWLPALADAAASAPPVLRKRGTLGGAIAGNDAGNRAALALLALDAVIDTSHGAHDANDYLATPFATTLADGELIEAVEFRRPLECLFAGDDLLVARFAEGHRVARSGARPAQRCCAAEQALDADFAANPAGTLRERVLRLS